MATPEQQTQGLAVVENNAVVQKGSVLDAILEKMVEYEPFQSKEKIQLTPKMVMDFLCKPTKSGKKCTMDQAVRFMMLCKARGLNPWEGDAFLVGYDTTSGPEFSLITAHQAFLKRAEVNEQFEGMDSGVIVQNKDGSLVEQPGDFFGDDQVVKGAWAKIFLKNRPQHPVYKRLRFDAFNKGFGRWKDDPGGMIVKCAEADALRTAFPNTLGGMYLEMELGNEDHSQDAKQRQPLANSAVAALESSILEEVVDNTQSTKLTDDLEESKKVIEAAKKKAAEKAEKAKAKAEKEAAEKKSPEPEKVADGEDVASIASEAAAKVEEKQPEPEKPTEQPKTAPQAAGGIELRGVTFPAVLTADESHEKYSDEQFKKANEEASRIGINLGVFVQKRLKADVGTLNHAAMEKLLELLKGVS